MIFEKKKVIEHKMRVLIFSTILSETFLMRIIWRDMHICRHVKEPVILVTF
jgi:hypothetical protein